MVSRRAFLPQIAVLAAAGAGAWWVRGHVLWPPPRPIFAQGVSSGWIPFTDSSQDLPVVAARVNGAEITALIDSGSQSSVLDRGLAKRLGVAAGQLSPVVLAFGVSGSPRLGRGAAVDVALPGVALRGLHAAIFDLEPVTEASRRDFGLILGQDVLAQVVADIDFPQGRLAFHARQGFTPPPDARAVPARAQGRELLVPVTVEAAPLELVLDTGASGALALSQATAQAAGLLSSRQVGSTPSIGFGGVAQDQVVQAGSVTFAGETRHGVLVHIYAPGQGAPVPSGLLGVGSLEGFRVILDIGAPALHLVAEGPRTLRRPRRTVLLEPR